MIERDEEMDRDYIQLPGGWEFQTQGKGSTARVCDTKTGERHPLALPKHVIEFLERMAKEVHDAANTEIERLNKVISSALPYCYYMDPPDGGYVEPEEQLKRMAQDAARYRWLRNRSTGEVEVYVHGEPPGAGVWGESWSVNLDKEIDSAAGFPAQD